MHSLRVMIVTLHTNFVQENFVVEFPELAGAVDHQICPACPTLLGCIYEGDVWMLDAKHKRKHQLTISAG